MSANAERLVQALQAADAAGDVESARTLAQALRQMQAQGNQPAFDRDAFMASEREKYSPANGMSTGDKLLSGAGKAFSDLGHGVQQYSTDLGNAVGLGRVMPGSFGDQEVQRQRDEEGERRHLDAPLMDTKAGMAGNLAGNVAGAAPAMFVPGANTVAGAALTGAGMGMLQPTVSDGERTKNTALGAGLGALGQWGGGKAAEWAGKKIASRFGNAAQQKAQNSVRDATIREGIDVGYSVPPSTTNPSAMNTAIESIAGKAATQSASSRQNQMVTNRLIREDLGMAADDPLTPDSLQAVRARAGKAYEAIKQTGEVKSDTQYYQELMDIADDNQAIMKSFPGAAKTDAAVLEVVNSLAQPKFKAEGAVEYVKKLRSDSKANFKASAINGDPAKRQLGQAQWDAAGTLEDMIERHLQSQGLGDLAGQFRQARTLIAKSHSAELALNEGTGNIQASKLVQQMRKGKPMSGNFETIAKFASAAPKAMAEPTQSGGVSALSAALAAGGVGLGQPGLLAVPAARWAARKMMLTPAMQRRIALSNYRPSRAGTSALKGTQGLGKIAAPLSVSTYATEQ